MTWHDPSSPTSHTAASEAWAMVTPTAWRAAWLNEHGDLQHHNDIVRPGETLSDGLLDHASHLLDQDFPQQGNLYIARPDCMVAPVSYQSQAVDLLHAVLDETIPAAAVRTVPLDYVKDACLIWVCSPALSTIWGKIAPQGALMPLVERDLKQVLVSAEEPDLAFIHVLSGYVQITLKKDGKLRLCNAFRYQEIEEAGLMCRAVIGQFFPKTRAAIHIMHNSESEAAVAANLLLTIAGAVAFIPDQSYWI